MDQHKAWTLIGASFDATRPEPWPVVVEWLDALPRRGRLLDLMSGNGRHGAEAVARGHDVLALDWSHPLCEAARDRGVPVVQGDATCLPLAPATFDSALYIAGLHGIPDARGRHASLVALREALRPGGQALLTVWSRHARRFQDLPHTGPADVVVPWRRDGHEVDRTYHLYTASSLRHALERAGFKVLGCADGGLDPEGAGSPENVVASVCTPKATRTPTSTPQALPEVDPPTPTTR